jgi:hypothetical protein
MSRLGSLILIVAFVGISAVGALAAQADPRPGVVSQIKILSDKIEDVSSMEAWKKSFIKDGMTDREKALAVWKTVVKFRQQCMPPCEYLQSSVHPHDPIRTFNVYGYNQCCCASSNIEALARYAGLEARGKGIHSHSVPEVFFDGEWHMLDASLITYFPKPDGKIASVDELVAGVTEWLKKNPNMDPNVKENDQTLRAFMRANGWKKGPEILANCPFYTENGWFPAKTHGWYSSLGEYDGKPNFPFEYGYSQGYQVNVQLREGERLTRNWSHKGLHVNALEGSECAALHAVPGEGDMRYSPEYGDIAPGRVGNGTLEYHVPLASGAFRGGSLLAENLAASAEDKQTPALHLKDAAAAGTLILRMPSSYIYLGGALNFDAVIGEGGAIAVSFSDNNGLGWKTLATVAATGPQQIDLKQWVYRRYDYRLKFEIKGKGSGLETLKIANDFQHSQRPLPTLAAGANKISFSTGNAEGTITVEGSMDPDRKNNEKNLKFSDFKPVLESFSPGFLAQFQDKGGRLTFPITTPGDMTRIRFGCFYRAQSPGDFIDLQVSFDGGKTFKNAGRCETTRRDDCKYVTFGDIPAGSRSVLVRYAGTRVSEVGIFDFRIDADYNEPSGGFRPVKVTYVWNEAGTEKKDERVIGKPDEQYEINCAGKPVMKSLIVELAP